MLRYWTAGESHGPALVALVDGFPAGLAVDKALIDAELVRRQGGDGERRPAARPPAAWRPPVATTLSLSLGRGQGAADGARAATSRARLARPSLSPATDGAEIGEREVLGRKLRYL